MKSLKILKPSLVKLLFSLVLVISLYFLLTKYNTPCNKLTFSENCITYQTYIVEDERGNKSVTSALLPGDRVTYQTHLGNLGHTIIIFSLLPAYLISCILIWGVKHK